MKRKEGTTCPLGAKIALVKRHRSLPESLPSVESDKNSVLRRKKKPVKIPEWTHGVVHSLRSRSGRHIFDLPPEILTKILLLLDVKQLQNSCKLVCKRFKYLIDGESFSQEKLKGEFGVEGYARLLTTKTAPIDARRFFNVNLYRGMYRWGHDADRPFVFRIKRNHCCSESMRDHFRSLLARTPAPVMPWMDEPQCYCLFGRSVLTSKLRERPQVFGWCMIDFIASGIPAEVLDIVRPPIAVGMWDPHPEARLGFSLGMKARLVAADNETLTRGECIYEIGPNCRQSVFQHYVFTDYPPGVRRVIFFGPNSFLVNANGRTNFCGATVKLLTHSAYCEFTQIANKNK